MSYDRLFDAIDNYLDSKGYSSLKVMDTLLYSCPYELYWMDKTDQMEMGYQVRTTSNSNLTVYGFYFSLPVEKEYQNGSTYTMSTAYGKSVCYASSNAKKIISSYSSLGDYEKPDPNLSTVNVIISMLTDCA